MENNKIYGLVLSGGGVRGMAHIGAIKALEEAGIYPQIISGASAGALVGAFYAAGYSPSEILNFFKKASMFKFSNYAIGKPGLLNTEKFIKIYLKYFPQNSFEALSKKLFISTTDIIHGKNKIFHSGELIKPLLASAAFPMVLTPIKIGAVLYADGGILNNFPTEPLHDRCDKIIGSYVKPLKEISEKELTSSLSVLERAYQLGIANQSMIKFKDCDQLFLPQELISYKTFDMNKLDEIYEIGYTTAKETLQQNTDIQ